MFDNFMVLLGAVLLITSNIVIFINGNYGPVELFILATSSIIIGGVVKEIKKR